MFIAVRYSSKDGNVQKGAQAIGKALDTPVETVSKALDKHVDALFLGADKAADVAKFIGDNASNIGKIVVFGPGAKIHGEVKSIAASYRVKTAEMPFNWPAAFLFLNKGHPTDEEVQAAAEFAKKQIKQLSMT